MIFGRKSIDRIMRYVMSGNHRHSKFAARLLVFMKNHDEVCAEVVEVCLGFFRSHAFTLSKHVPYFSLQAIADALPEADPEHLAAHIAVLAQLALRSPDAFELKSDVLIVHDHDGLLVQHRHLIEWRTRHVRREPWICYHSWRFVK